MTRRPVAQVIDTIQTLEGGGFPVRRPFPVAQLMQFDPFLLFDHLGPVTWGQVKALAHRIIRIAVLNPSPIYCREKCS